jgi:hypothetical protein
MKRSLRVVEILAGATLFAALAAVHLGAQSPTAKAYTPPKTANGQPDLQGVWGYATITPLERPTDLADKAVLSDQEARELERQTAVTQDRDRRDNGPGGGRASDGRTDLDRAYNEFWWDKGSKVVGTRQTSLIVDPSDGKLPPLTAEGKVRAEARRGLATNNAREEGGIGRGFDSYETRPLGERCILWRTAGPPMLPGPYNNNVQIFQTPDYVVIFNEMVHEHRIVPLDGRAHVSTGVRQLMGDSRGHFEGNTLVVETTNFDGKAAFQGASDKMQLVERFTRVAADTVMYEFTVSDPTTFAKAWTARYPMTHNPEPIYEYACHEGNYSLATILAGARTQEKAATDAARTGSR